MYVCRLIIIHYSFFTLYARKEIADVTGRFHRLAKSTHLTILKLNIYSRGGGELSQRDKITRVSLFFINCINKLFCGTPSSYAVEIIYQIKMRSNREKWSITQTLSAISVFNLVHDRCAYARLAIAYCSICCAILDLFKKGKNCLLKGFMWNRLHCAFILFLSVHQI